MKLGISKARRDRDLDNYAKSRDHNGILDFL
jgi:hypothetical protein